MADCYEVFTDTQAAALQNVNSAISSPDGHGPKFRPGTSQENPNHYTTPDPPASFVFSSDQRDAFAQIGRLCAQAQDAINATERNGRDG